MFEHFFCFVKGKKKGQEKRKRERVKERDLFTPSLKSGGLQCPRVQREERIKRRKIKKEEREDVKSCA